MNRGIGHLTLILQPQLKVVHQMQKHNQVVTVVTPAAAVTTPTTTTTAATMPVPMAVVAIKVTSGPTMIPLNQTPILQSLVTLPATSATTN